MSNPPEPDGQVNSKEKKQIQNISREALAILATCIFGH